jgi:archaeosine-15-forming tRNA-guanine transglycosylase
MSQSKKVSEVQTEGKAFIVMRTESGSLFRVGLEGGGVVPEALAGLYTTPKVAEQSIQMYLSKRG